MSPDALAAANVAALREYLTAFAANSGGEVRGEEGVTTYRSDVPHAIFNGVFRTHLSEASADLTIDAVRRSFESRRLPYTWWVEPDAAPENLPRRLVTHGMHHLFDAPGMAVDLAALPPPPPTPETFAIEAVEDADTLREWTGPLQEGFGLRGAAADRAYDLFARLGFGPRRTVHHFLGRLDGTPVATAQLFYGAGVALLGFVATEPRARGKGIGTAITLAPLRAARVAGIRVGVLQSSPMGYSVYRRIGFLENCRIGVYVDQGT